MTLSVTLHAWYAYLWLTIGVLSAIPMRLVARLKVSPRMSWRWNLWPTYHGWTTRHRAVHNVTVYAVGIVLWPLGWLEVLGVLR